MQVLKFRGLVSAGFNCIWLLSDFCISGGSRGRHVFEKEGLNRGVDAFGIRTRPNVTLAVSCGEALWFLYSTP
jgi:hypothetical protein